MKTSEYYCPREKKGKLSWMKKTWETLLTTITLFFKMAPRKIKTQGKRNSIKIKSKSNKEKRALKVLKKDKKHENSPENLKWLNDMAEKESFQKDVPEWLHDGPYKRKIKTSVSGFNVSESEEEQVQDEHENYSGSESSEECTCNYSEHAKNGILRQKTSSDSVVGNYIKTGMNQVASFIVESAIRFGEQHGVVVPDKNNPNLYEFTPADKSFGEKLRKIRFKIPEKSSNYKVSKKIRWRNQKPITEEPVRSVSPVRKATWRENRSDSIEEILPILKKIKQEGEFEEENLDVEKTSGSEDGYEEIHRERMKNRFRKRGKRHKSVESIAETVSDKEYPAKGSKWRKFRRDSIELGRQRLRAATGSRKQESTSQKSS